jgi:hypothetical protein
VQAAKLRWQMLTAEADPLEILEKEFARRRAAA